MLELAANLPSEVVVHPKRGNRWPIWQPIVAVLFMSALIRVWDLDRTFSRPWYDASHHVWPLERAEPFYLFYLYGVYPPWILGLTGLFAAIMWSYLWPETDRNRLKSIRHGGVFLILMLVIGPGFLVNGCFKALWGRPRPIHCKDFGGKLDFRPIGEWSVPQVSPEYSTTSFPSGHASVAFFLIGPAFLFDPLRTRRHLYWFAAGAVYGIAMGLTRIMQGGHFLSDVLWAGLIVYLVGALLAGIIVRYE